MSEHPPTVIVVHPREKRRKCTVEPLRGRDGFVFHRFPKPLELPDGPYVRLGLGGPELSPADTDAGLLILDGTWRLADVMASVLPELPIRSLPPWKTAYPRTSKVREDPADGLATIEALYLAYHLLGRPTDGLLDHYYWAESFLDLNLPECGEESF